MKKLFRISFLSGLLSLFLVVACQQVDNSHKEIRVDSRKFDKLCLEGVTYVRNFENFSVQLNRDSKIIPCDEKTYQ